jgi:crotonobetainyl-CoA:carnitine CoA-transferase CaiB-like acyl-CoA transferase
MPDIAVEPQLDARHFWQDLAGPDGQHQRHCGSFAMVDQVRAPLRHFPGEAVELEALLAELGASAVAQGGIGKAAAARRSSAVSQALSGVKVAEFGAYAAGPHIGKMLATFGATVVHVESHQHPDGFRNEYPPFKDGRPGPNRGGCFAIFNDSKYAVTLDLKHAPGIDLARRLVGWADVVIENMRPEVMSRLGLGYDKARELNPGVVMISSCNMGQTGPRAHTPGFGSQLSALAGFCGLTGDPDGSPMLLYGPYIDFIASTFGAASVLAALDRQRRTGQGAWIDLAQYESGLLFIAGALLEHQKTGAIATRSCNSDANAAPHGAYPCRDGQWLALSCWSDEEFGRFSGVLGRPELAADRRFSTLALCQAHGEELDAIIAAWSLTQDADEAAAMLQAARVHAYPVNTIAGLFSDPQLLHRRMWRRRLHGAIGDLSCYYSAFELSATPGDVMAAAPLIGEHNALVFREFLGMTEAQYADYQQQGAFA